MGLEKQAYLDWVMGPADQAAQLAVKRAFDPLARLNPGKPFSGPLEALKPARLAGLSAGSRRRRWRLALTCPGAGGRRRSGGP